MSHDPLDLPLNRYLLFALIGLFGGLVARLQYWAGGEIPHCVRCALFRLLVDMMTSGFCGVLTFWLATEFELSGVLTAVLAGISGHMGSRSLFLVERILQKRLQRLAEMSEGEAKGKGEN